MQLQQSLGKVNLWILLREHLLVAPWTERIGPTAALKTLEIMYKEKLDKITSIGRRIKKKWNDLAQKYELPIKIEGLDALASFKLENDSWQIYKTYISQEMLKKGFLASNSVYASTAHNNEIINEYFFNLDPIFEKISDTEKVMQPH